MKKLVMNLNDAQLSAMVAWCKSNNISFDVIDSAVFSTPLPTFSQSSDTVVDNNTSTEDKSKFVHTKDFTVKFEVKKLMPKGGKKELFCISRANGWTKAEKACANDRIKALADIKTIEVEYTDKNGKVKTFSAWGYDTKKKAEEMIATLNTTITVAELNARF